MMDSIMNEDFNPISKPKHYSGDGNIDCMTAMNSMVYGADIPPMQIYWWGCVFKYLWRWPHKNGLQDLEKAKMCLDYLIADAKKRSRKDTPEEN